MIAINFSKGSIYIVLTRNFVHIVKGGTHNERTSQKRKEATS